MYYVLHCGYEVDSWHVLVNVQAARRYRIYPRLFCNTGRGQSPRPVCKTAEEDILYAPRKPYLNQYVYVITPFRVLLLVYKPDTRGAQRPRGEGL